MSRVSHIERVFTTRARAEAWMERLKPTAWPYIWCFESPRGRWTVAALVEHGGRRSVA